MAPARHSWSTPPAGPDDGFSRLSARLATSASAQQLSRAIGAACDWLGQEAEPRPDGMRRYLADMRLQVGDRPSIVTFGKAAFVDIGMPMPLDQGWEVEIAWRASTLAPLFPVFAGTLVARPGELSVSGWYAPPGGPIGRVADRVVLHVAATGTGRWLLKELDSAARRWAD